MHDQLCRHEQRDQEEVLDAMNHGSARLTVRSYARAHNLLAMAQGKLACRETLERDTSFIRSPDRLGR